MDTLIRESLITDLLIKYGFCRLSISDKELFDGYYNKMNEKWASSICFTSMIAWNDSIRIYHKVIGDFLCCLAWDSNTQRWVMLPFLGYYESSSMEKCASLLRKLFKELKQPIIFTDISEWMLPYYLSMKVIKLKASYDPGLSDYIYTKTDFLEALDNQSSRYNYHYFIRKQEPRLIIMSKENVELYLDFITKLWCGTHSCEYCQYGCLVDADRTVIRNIDEVGAKGISVFVSSELVGFTIVTLERDQLVFHFKKTRHNYRGLSEYMHKECCELFGTNAAWINYTEDMNIEGLRKYKQKLAKFELSHKYELCEIG